MGPALATRSTQIVAGYASVAGNTDVHNIHHSKGIFPGTASSMAGIEKCPHASAARAAARIAADLASAAKDKKDSEAKAQGASVVSGAAAAAGCPFHKSAPELAAPKPGQKAKVTTPGQFNYENFYDAELEKKHKDQSYRYFNNINRLAAKFPVAHTGNVKEEVEVWCANDYLGMGNNPVVLETMQYVQTFNSQNIIFDGINFQPGSGQIWRWCRRYP
jgi:5-aminolevulinate synthase